MRIAEIVRKALVVEVADRPCFTCGKTVERSAERSNRTFCSAECVDLEEASRF